MTPNMAPFEDDYADPRPVSERTPPYSPGLRPTFFGALLIAGAFSLVAWVAVVVLVLS